MPPRFGGAPKCPRCDKFVYMAEQVLGPNSVYYHKLCFTCKECNKLLDSSTMAEREGQPYCKTCYNRMWGPKGYGSAGRSFLHTETKTAREVLAESDWAAERAAEPAMSSPVVTNRGQSQVDQSLRDDRQAPSPSPALPARPSNSPALPARPAVPAKTHSTPPAIPPKPTNITSTDRPSAYMNSRTGYVPKQLNMQISGDLCAKCNKPVYAAELVLGASRKYHKMCLRCSTCNKLLDSSNMVDKDFTIYCRPCHSKAFGPKGYGYGGLLSTEGGIIEINPDLYELADSLDKERKNGHVRGPMHGIPILVKDNIATADKMNTTCGSDALLGSVVPRDAHVVSLLREAGAIIMGKANLAEWADIRSTNYSEGWSARGGQSRNAYNLTQDPAGSSSGSAHSVAANMVSVAIGTETDGSVIGPAQRAGIIGIKPTVGITSRSGAVPEAHSQDTVGVFGRTFMDAVHVLNIIRGVDDEDPVTRQQLGRIPPSYVPYVSVTSALKGIRIGIPWNRVWQSSTTTNQLPQLLYAIYELKEAGAIIINNTDIPSIEEISSDPPSWNWTYKNSLGRNNESEFTVVCYEFKRDLNKYLAELKESPVRTLTDIIQYNLDHSETEMKYFKQELLVTCDADPFTEEEYKAAIAYTQKTTRKEGIDAALKKYNVEALLVPSDNWSLSSQIPAQAGYPMVTIPAGIDLFGVPFGISLWGTAYSEPMLIKIGSAIDDTLRRRVSPQFLEHQATNIPVTDQYGIYYP